MSKEENAKAVRALFEGFNNQNLDQAAAVVAPDFELIDVPVGMTFHGPEGLRQWLGAWAQAAPGAQTEVKNLVATDDDWVFSEHIGRGTHTGPLVTPMGEIPPTQRAFELQMAEVYRLQDGKIVEMRAYWDTATLLRQLGVMG